MYINQIRRGMQFIPGTLYHVFNQGNNQQTIFFGGDNYLYFLKKMRAHLTNKCDLIAWCLMPNHFHWLIKIPDEYPANFQENNFKEDKTGPVVYPLNRSISTLLSSYTKAINKAHGKSGSLFRSRTKAINLMDDDLKTENYPLICFLYIHQNAFRAGLADNLHSWEYSSFRDYADLRKGSLCNIKLGRQLFNLPDTKEEFVKFSNRTIPPNFLDRLI